MPVSQEPLSPKAPFIHGSTSKSRDDAMGELAAPPLKPSHLEATPSEENTPEESSPIDP